MPKKIDPNAEGAVLGLFSAGFKGRALLSELLKLGFQVSQTFVYNVLKNKGKRNKPKPKDVHHRSKVSPPPCSHYP